MKIFDGITSRVIASVVILLLIMWWRADQNKGYQQFLQSPQGHQQALANAEIDKIRECRKAVEAGAVPTECGPASNQSVGTKVILVPKPWPSLKEN